MPFTSEKQRRYLWKFHPEIAQKWSDKYGSKIKKGKKKRKSSEADRKRMAKMMVKK